MTFRDAIHHGLLCQLIGRHIGVTIPKRMARRANDLPPIAQLNAAYSIRLPPEDTSHLSLHQLV
jgi:hypothetical protein